VIDMSGRLQLLGRPRALAASGAALHFPNKAYALAAFLAYAGDASGAPRRALAEFLWEGADPSVASANLRQLLVRIRDVERAHNVRLFEDDGQHMRLGRDHFSIDLDQFLELTRERLRVNLAELCDLYGGELLADQDGEPKFAQWLRLRRAECREAFIASVSRQLEPLPPRVDRTQLLRAARRLIEVDGYNEVGPRTLMRLHAEGGRLDLARNVYNELKTLLAKELETEVDPATAQLVVALHAPENRQKPSINPVTDARGAGNRAPGARLSDRASVEDAAMEPVRSAGVPKLAILMPPPVTSEAHATACALIDDVTIGLCRFKGLTVVAPHTAWQLAEEAKQQDAFQRFNLDYVAESRLHPLGSEAVLAVKLYSARSREIIWADHFAFTPASSAQQYRELSLRIMLSLTSRVERAELARYDLAQHPTAYHWYLVGRQSLTALDLPSARRARQAFKTAVSLAPEFVPAISGLARTYQIEWLLLARGDGGLLAEAGRLAARAIELDENDARGYRESGICHLYARHYDACLDAYARAEDLNPQHADLIADHADALVHSSDPEAALAKINRAIELNPLAPDSYWWTAGGANYLVGNYAASIEAIARMNNRTPALQLQAASHAMLGARAAAAECVEQAREVHPEFSIAKWLSIVPFKDERHIRHYEEGLRLAGFD
jgi:DNA-binding SARP family transcriptional activator/tetratricopeptide (TPR) repeat protein